MNAAELLRHYERVANAPSAIPRLRQFILELAVRGKLVSQDQRDESAEALLRRIGAERRRQLIDGKIRASKAQELELAQHPFTLPETWAWAALGSVFLYDAGAKCEPRMLDPGYWLLELEDLEKDTGRLLTRLRVSDRQSQSTKSEFRPGDVLYGKLRPYLNKVLVADEAGYSTTEIVALRAYLPLCSEYCALALRRPDFVDYVTRLGQGTKMPRLRTEDAVVAPFPLPPLAEQYRIVSKVDELMTLCDRLETAQAERETARDRLAAASLARLNAPDPETFADDASFALNALPSLTARPDQIKQIRQTILSLAVQGKLLTQNHEDQSAGAWYRAATGQSASAFEERASSLNLPSGWISLPMAAAFEVAGGIQKTPDRTPRGNAFPYLGVGNVYRGRLDLSTVKEFELAPGELERRRLLPGDLLIIEGNGSITEIGRCAKWNGEIEGCVHQNHVIRCRPCDSSISDFTLLVLNSPVGVANMQSLAITSSGLFSLSVGKIRQIELPLPPLSEQRRVVAKVKELLDLCDQLESSLIASDGHRYRLLEALLHDALESGHHAAAPTHVTEAAA